MLERIIDHHAPPTAPGTGLPIGNLPRQYFANLYLDGVRSFLHERLCLRLKENKCYVAPISQGIPFLGMRLYPGTIWLAHPSLVQCRSKRRCKEIAFAEGRIAEDELLQTTGSLIAHIAHANTMALQRRWLAAP